jgi:hypothetical protein
MIEVEADGFLFRFENAIEAYVFDEKDRQNPNFHKPPMKAVDIIAEFENDYVFIEIKDFEDPQLYNTLQYFSEEENKIRKDHFKWLKNYLKYKYRDTFLCRHAEQKVDKPIRYICLLVNFDNPLSLRLQQALRSELPVGMKSRKWVKEIARGCVVVNLEKWNEKFSKWPVQRLSSSVRSDSQVPQEQSSAFTTTVTVRSNNDIDSATLAVSESAGAALDS